MLKGGEKTLSVIKKLLRTLLASCPKFSEDHAQVIKDYLKRKDFVAEEDYQEIVQYFPGPTPPESLAHLNPELMSEWDFEANKLLRPENVKPGSEEEAWWKCEHGHSWKAPIKFRARGGGACLRCRSLAFLYSEIAEDWHPIKNKKTPWDFCARSSKRAWWKCKTCEHEWEAVISNRSGGWGCPKCKSTKQSRRQRLPEPDRSLGDVRPDLAAEWHPALNLDSEGKRITPWDVKPNSSSKFWWICKMCGFVWQDSASHRNHGRGCPPCGTLRRGRAKARPKAGESFGDLYPEMVKDWDTEKNDRTPYEVKRGSGYRAAWKCAECGNAWVARVMDRTVNKSGCPVCWREKRNLGYPKQRKKPGPGQSLGDRFPELAKEWDFEANGGLTPFDVFPKTNERMAWICRHGHRWKTVVYARTRRHGTGCPHCARLGRKGGRSAS